MRVTVATRFLERRFGGTLVPHVRDTDAWDPQVRRRSGAGRARGGRPAAGDVPRHAASLQRRGRSGGGGADAGERRDPGAGGRQCRGARRPAAGARRPYVRVVGEIPFDDVPRWLSPPTWWRFPSARPPTPRPIAAKLVDAMALARPIVATAVAMIPEILGDGGVAGAARRRRPSWPRRSAACSTTRGRRPGPAPALAASPLQLRRRPRPLFPLSTGSPAPDEAPDHRSALCLPRGRRARHRRAGPGADPPRLRRAPRHAAGPDRRPRRHAAPSAHPPAAGAGAGPRAGPGAAPLAGAPAGTSCRVTSARCASTSTGRAKAATTPTSDRDRARVSRGLYHRVLLALERRVFERTPRIVAIAQRGQARDRALYAVSPDARHGDLQRRGPRAVPPPPRVAHRAAARAEAGLPGEAWTAIFVGSGFERKGLATAIEALALVNDRGTRLAVAGRGDAARYRALAERLGVGGACPWLGLRPDIERWYAAADACVLPTRYEPFGNVHLEALAAGLPVVASETAGGSELVEPGRSAPVVDPRDREALAAARGASAGPRRSGRLAAPPGLRPSPSRTGPGRGLRPSLWGRPAGSPNFLEKSEASP